MFVCVVVCKCKTTGVRGRVVQPNVGVSNTVTYISPPTTYSKYFKKPFSINVIIGRQEALGYMIFIYLKIIETCLLSAILYNSSCGLFRRLYGYNDVVFWWFFGVFFLDSYGYNGAPPMNASPQMPPAYTNQAPPSYSQPPPPEPQYNEPAYPPNPPPQYNNVISGAPPNSHNYR